MAKATFGRRIFAAALVGLLSASLTACNNSGDKQVGDARINIEPYSKVEFNTEKVKSGDIQSSLSLDLKPDGYSSKDYSIQQSDYKIEEVKVKEGDKVAKGDVMIQFQPTEIRKTIEQYTRDWQRSTAVRTIQARYPQQRRIWM